MEKKRKTKRKVKNSIETPVVRYDPSLDKYEGVVRNSRKLDELNEKLKNNPVFRESLIEMMEKYK
jgi:hypothetical protein